MLQILMANYSEEEENYSEEEESTRILREEGFRPAYAKLLFGVHQGRRGKFTAFQSHQADANQINKPKCESSTTAQDTVYDSCFTQATSTKVFKHFHIHKATPVTPFCHMDLSMVW